MFVRPEQLRTSLADGTITKSGSLGGAGNDSNVLGHGLIPCSDSKMGAMRAGKTIRVLLLSFLSMAPHAHSETGEQGWLRYAALTPQAAQQFKKMPQHVVAGGQSAVSHSAASELARGLHAMLGENVTVSSALPNGDSFLLGTPGEIQRLLTNW